MNASKLFQKYYLRGTILLKSTKSIHKKLVHFNLEKQINLMFPEESGSHFKKIAKSVN